MKFLSLNLATLFVSGVLLSTSAHAAAELSCNLVLTTGSKVETSKMRINRFEGMSKKDGHLAATELVELEDGSRARVDVSAMYIQNKISAVSMNISQEKDVPLIGLTRSTVAQIKSSEKAQDANLQIRFGAQELKARCQAK